MAKKKEEVDDIFEEEKGFMERVGPLSFILGLVIAAVSATTGTVFWLLAALGLVVGLLNVTEKETNTFLIASITFLASIDALSSTLNKLASHLPIIGQWLNFIDPLLANIAIFVAPGAATVALKALYNISKD